MKLRSKQNLIAVDGVDGAGKSTALKTISEYLAKRFPKKVTNVAEGAIFNDFSRDVKSLIYRHKQNGISHDVLYNLYRAIWVDTWQKFGKQIDNKEMFLVTDRWLLSAAVYQASSNESQWHLMAATQSIPGLTFLMKVSEVVAVKRILAGRGELDVFEKEYFAKHDQIQNEFIKKSDVFCDKVVIIDTDNLSKEQVSELIIKELDEYFKDYV